MTHKYLETEVVIAMSQQFARQFAELRILPIPISSRCTNLSISSGNEAKLWS